MTLRECNLREAPSYFDFWAAKSSEYQYRAYSAKHGGIPAVMSMSFKTKRLNDGNTYVLGWNATWTDPIFGKHAARRYS